MLEDFIAAAKGLPGVRFARLDTVLSRLGSLAL